MVRHGRWVLLASKMNDSWLYLYTTTLRYSECSLVSIMCVALLYLSSLFSRSNTRAGSARDRRYMRSKTTYLRRDIIAMCEFGRAGIVWDRGPRTDEEEREREREAV